MSARLLCPPAPGPLGAFAVQFGPLFQTLAQRQGFRTYLSGLQFFLSEAARDARRLSLLADEPATAPSAEGVRIIDDTGERKDGSATDHVAPQYPVSASRASSRIKAFELDAGNLGGEVPVDSHLRRGLAFDVKVTHFVEVEQSLVKPAHSATRPRCTLCVRWSMQVRP